jgi:hypothetical protein
MAEGDAPTVYEAVIDDHDLPTGWYKVVIALDWVQPVDKYMEFLFTINGADSRTYRRVSHYSSPLVNDFTTTFYIPLIVTPHFHVDFQVEFPDQAGSASGIFQQVQIAYEMWGDFPTPT